MGVGRKNMILRIVVALFALLALGDTGHVGFRVWAYALGDLDATIRLFGVDLGLVGLGALATAITVTLFYVMVQFIWKRRFQKPYGWFGWLLFGSVVVRFILMIPAATHSSKTASAVSTKTGSLM